MMSSTSEWYGGYDKAERTIGGSDWPFTVIDYKTMDQEATDKAIELLWKSGFMRNQHFPAKWIADVERKALRWLERSFDLRHLFDRRYPRPDVIPPPAYTRDVAQPPSN